MILKNNLIIGRVIVTKIVVVHSDATSHCSGRTEPANWPSGPANFALGSASSQLQEVLVTDLPRSFNRGERETRGGGGRDENEEGREKGRIQEDRFFNFHCST